MSFKERIKSATKKNWVSACIWGCIYVAFIVWVAWDDWASLAWLLLLPIILDMFITKYIPWKWWKKWENKTARNVMSWVDSIVFALVAVYFVHIMLINFWRDLLSESLAHVYYQIPIITLCSFLSSYAVVWILSKLPKAKVWLGS